MIASRFFPADEEWDGAVIIAHFVRRAMMKVEPLTIYTGGGKWETLRVLKLISAKGRAITKVTLGRGGKKFF